MRCLHGESKAKPSKKLSSWPHTIKLPKSQPLLQTPSSRGQPLLRTPSSLPSIKFEGFRAFTRVMEGDKIQGPPRRTCDNPRRPLLEATRFCHLPKLFCFSHSLQLTNFFSHSLVLLFFQVSLLNFLPLLSII